MAEVHLFVMRIVKFNNEKKPSKMIKKALVQLLEELSPVIIALEQIYR